MPRGVSTKRKASEYGIRRIAVSVDKRTSEALTRLIKLYKRNERAALMRACTLYVDYLVAQGEKVPLDFTIITPPVLPSWEKEEAEVEPAHE